MSESMDAVLEEFDAAGERVVVWVNGDCLSPYGPALAAHPGAPALWVWDEGLLEEWRLSLKRVVFLYESLLELPVAIRRGDVAEEVAAFAREHGAARVVTTVSPSPRFGEIREALEASLPVEVLEPEPFLSPSAGRLNLRSFSSYWRGAERYAWGES